MFCEKCGNKIADNAKFCPYCGNKIGQPQVPVNAQPGGYSAPRSTGSYQAPAKPADSGSYQAPAKPANAGSYQAPAKPANAGGHKFQQPKKSHAGLIAGIIGGVAAVVIVAVVLVMVLGGSPTAKVGKAMSATVDAYGSMLSNTPVFQAGKTIANGSFQETLRVEILDTYDPDFDPNGLGFALSAGVDLKGRQAMLGFTGFYGAADLMDADLILDDEIASVGCPELLGNDRYGVNTMVLGDSLAAIEPEMEGVGFNFFELAEIYQNFMKEQTAQSKEYSACFETLLKAAEIEKDGKEKLDINGERKECEHYTVVFPADAVLDCVDAIGQLMEQTDYMQLAEDLVTALNLPADVEDELLEEVEMELYYSLPDTDSFYEDMEYLLEDLGDPEFDVYLNKGKLAAVIWEYRPEELGMEMYFGGPDAYEDDLSIILTDTGDAVEIRSSGSHTGKDGVYTDKTVINDGYSEMVSELYYEPKADGNNFSWEIYEDGGTGFFAEGNLTASGKEYILILDSVGIQEWDETIAEFALEFSISEFQKLPKTDKAIMVLDMSESEMGDAADEISENATYWLLSLIEQFPELEYMFY